MQAFYVVAISLRFEGLPLVLLEAMLGGCAIVVTGVGSILDALQDGETGLVVPVDDAGALAGAPQRLMSDPGLRLRLGTAAAEKARRHLTARASGPVGVPQRARLPAVCPTSAAGGRAG
jgi:glycosyltransferase involved in cell wall biosynthesis